MSADNRKKLKQKLGFLDWKACKEKYTKQIQIYEYLGFRLTRGNHVSVAVCFKYLGLNIKEVFWYRKLAKICDIFSEITVNLNLVYTNFKTKKY